MTRAGRQGGDAFTDDRDDLRRVLPQFATRELRAGGEGEACELRGLTLSGGLTNLGTVSLSPGTTNRLDGGGSATGTFNAPATALVEWIGGTFVMNPGAQLNGSGLYRLNFGSVTANTNLAVENLDMISAFSTLGGSVSPDGGPGDGAKRAD